MPQETKVTLKEELDAALHADRVHRGNITVLNRELDMTTNALNVIDKLVTMLYDEYETPAPRYKDVEPVKH